MFSKISALTVGCGVEPGLGSSGGGGSSAVPVPMVGCGAAARMDTMLGSNGGGDSCVPAPQLWQLLYQ